MIFSPVFLVLFWSAVIGAAFMLRNYVPRFAGWRFISLLALSFFSGIALLMLAAFVLALAK